MVLSIPSASATSPPDAVDNNPLVEPLAILDTKLNKLVLVQWLGLAPEDTSWEKWDDLEALYHREDKVVFSLRVLIVTQLIVTNPKGSQGGLLSSMTLFKRKYSILNSIFSQLVVIEL